MQTINKDIWNQIKSSLKAKHAANKLLMTWFDPVDFVSSEKTPDGEELLRLGVPSTLHQYWIKNNFMDRILSELQLWSPGPFKIDLLYTGQTMNQNFEPVFSVDETNSGSADVEVNKSTDLQTSKLNPDYTFNTFVVGPNNEFAHAACFGVAEKPGAGFNPLFICGPTGMGKTHLLNAVGNYIKEHYPHLRISYLSAERFLNEFIIGVRRRTMDKFRLRYRERCDVLLLDDIQVLGRGESVQDEFFHTLNDFFETKRQVVVASDRMPKDINGLEDRIRSRLEWGLIADIRLSDLETRVAILRYKAEIKNLRISDDVVQYIAKISKRSIRELEGNLNKVKIYTEFNGVPLTLDLAKKVLGSHVDETRSLTIDQLQKLVADHFGIKVADLKSKSRSENIVVPRQICMMLAKKYLNMSLSDIGRSFNRDHSTVINALQRVENQQVEKQKIYNDIKSLETSINNILDL